MSFVSTVCVGVCVCGVGGCACVCIIYLMRQYLMRQYVFICSGRLTFSAYLTLVPVRPCAANFSKTNPNSVFSSCLYKGAMRLWVRVRVRVRL